MESFWLVVTALGRDEAFIVVLALYTWLVRPTGGRDLGVAFALSYLVNTALKYGLNEPRPFATDPAVASEAAKATAGGPGLPSGHAQMSATLWGGIAAQVNRSWMWAVAAVLVVLVAGSRLALHVHYPVDVLVGLLLGAVFAGLAARVHFPQVDVLRWAPPLVALVVAAFLPSGGPREYAVGLGLFAGFWFSRPTFRTPDTVAGRVIVGLLGLLVVFAVYFGLSALPHGLRDLGLVRALRYAVLVLVAVEGVPVLLRRWLPRVDPAPSATAEAPARV
ncbi:phosphatase PAP2 family protein [Deinococcus sp. KSM4-11]|uniref:phosphatase PAP2 family protein n=1 Tax=Deinococcus sp. KSM4-11 TaxID=2568654 RepID=UPI0010A4E2E7|nr:phosphatase PAP2 family protein [Deinococcus sp. KSM4-11]THF88763.1 phosphatase PAP2 family protein [Deinococcus sp. KSM4-11]